MKNILVKFRIDYSTYILILLGLFAGYIKNIFIILLIVFVHELGHVFFFYLYNIEIESIVIYPFGGVSKINKKIHERIYKDVLISLGGVLFQLLLYIFMFFLYKYNIVVVSTFSMFKMYNFSIILFNLLPLIPLDGSKLVMAFFSKFLSYRISYFMMVILGFVSLFLFVIYNFIYCLNDIFIYIFLIFNLFISILDFKCVMEKFYMERVLYNNYYDGIISSSRNVKDMRINKYYYYMVGNRFVNEKDFLLKKY